jgi:hypothetical protein
LTPRRSYLHTSRQLLSTLLIVLLALSACCGGNSVNDWKTLTVTNYIAGFSCEYRAYYDSLDGPQIVDSTAHRFTYVYILAPKKHMQIADPEPGGGGDTVQMKYVPASLHMRVADGSRYPDSPAVARIEESLKDWGAWPNFELLEQSAVTVAGIEAELIAYQVDGFFAGPALEYRVRVSFDHEGLHWDIDASADIDMAEMVRQDFNHVIETFEILE